MFTGFEALKYVNMVAKSLKYAWLTDPNKIASKDPIINWLKKSLQRNNTYFSIKNRFNLDLEGKKFNFPTV